MTGPGLNNEQLEAALSLEGDLLINAGAGSGKTRTMVERYANALVEGRADGWSRAEVDEILAITFTDKAAGELADRLRRLLRAGGHVDAARRVDAAWVSTIHGFCSRLLRRHALEAGLDPWFTVADSVEAGVLSEEAFERVARTLIQEGAPGKRLFGEYGFDPVFRAVKRTVSRLAALGWPPSALYCSPASGAAELVSSAIEVVNEARIGLQGCPESAGTAAHLGQCCATGEVLEALDHALGEVEVAEAVLGALAAYKGPGRVSAAVREVTTPFAHHRAHLTELAADIVTRPFAETLTELTASYAAEYARLKAERSVLDFDDLQAQALRLLTVREDLKLEYRRRFRLVMVDEFQDTDELQLALIRAVSDGNLCTVGDERQSIYRFRGADIAVYRDHNASMLKRGAKAVELTYNYRSHAAILDLVNGVFAHECMFGPGLSPLRHGRSEPETPFVTEDTPRVQVVLADRPSSAAGPSRRAEAEAVARRFGDLHREQGVAPSDMVVLLRTYTHADEYVRALRAEGLGALIVGGSRFFGLPETSMLRALLRVVANPADDLALIELLVSPMSALSDSGLFALRLSSQGERRSSCLWEALAAGVPGLSEDDAAASSRLAQSIGDARARLGAIPLSELVLRAMEETDTDLEMLSRGDEGRQAYANVLQFARMADSFEAAGGSGPAAFTAYLDAKERFGEPIAPAALTDEESPVVRIMSVHASKGLEFPVVAVAGLGDQTAADKEFVRTVRRDSRLEVALKLPSSWSAGDGSIASRAFASFKEADRLSQIEEAQRVFYVACTRAEQILILAGACNTGTPPDQSSPIAWLRTACGAALDVEPGEVHATDICGVPGSVEIVVPTEELDVVQREEVPRPSRPPCTQAMRSPQPGTGLRTPEKMSYSDFALFESCRMRFWAQRQLRIGSLRDSGNGPTDFGSAVHAVLQVAGESGGVIPDGRLEAIARHFGLAAGDRGRLEDAVVGYLSSEVASQVAALPVRRFEMPFGLPLGDPASFLLVGAIDVLASDGPNGIVVDYKSGTAGEEDELRERYMLQARCYGLAALRSGLEAVRVVFVRPEVSTPDGPQTVEFMFDATDDQGLEDEFVTRWRHIGGAQPEPLPVWVERHCRSCPAAGSLCPLPVPSLR